MGIAEVRDWKGDRQTVIQVLEFYANDTNAVIRSAATNALQLLNTKGTN